MPRARDLGIRIGRLPSGDENAITDIEGIRVGHTTLIEGVSVRTGVTVVVPPPESLFAGAHRINGNGELTGLEWIRDSGLLTTPIGLTNTHSVGVVRDALVDAAQHEEGSDRWSLPVVGETWDGFLNDINGFHVKPEHVASALAGARGGAVEEGAVGGGTGMVCHGFKGGIGTASRVVEDGWTVGVLVQANHGRRARLRIDGAPVGERIGADSVALPGDEDDSGSGSIIVLIATDAPLLPGQCEHLARRASYGIARTGGMGETTSGDFALCLSTGNRGLDAEDAELSVRMLNETGIDALYEATIDAVEESILNAMLGAETMTGRHGTAHALPHDLLVEALRLS
ncbi:MAG: P1 family peptidase [Actinomycetota bacterium]|nr:P1 family peptidase [Actinomycetota bacterium]